MTYLAQLAATLQALDVAAVNRLLVLPLAARSRERTLFVCGNGGSYAAALHWAADLEKAGGVKTRCLGANGAGLTAYANDCGQANALALELARYAVRGDALVCLSVSGTSPNIAEALRVARVLGLHTALVTARGDAGAADVVVTVPSDDYGIVEDVAAALGHACIAALREV